MLAVDLRRSSVVERLELALANELERIDDFLMELLHTSFPQNATDANGTLSIWEMTMGLPVQPEGMSEQDRRDALLARLVARNADEGQDWTNAATLIIGPDWSYRENYPGPDQLTVLIPFAPGTPEADRIEVMLRDITPAHLELIVTFSGGFIVGESEVGEDAI